jgi:nucleotide-binding universal stress UspA family protein
MQPILLATDGSPSADTAAAKAIELAIALDAPLLVVAIWDVEYAPVGSALGMTPIPPDLTRIGEDHAEAVVQRTADTAQAAGVHVRTIVRRGIPVQRICELAEERDARLIVIGSHGWGPIRRFVFGSVSTGVLHHATCPVLIVPAVSPEVDVTEADTAPVELEV